MRSDATISEAAANDDETWPENQWMEPSQVVVLPLLPLLALPLPPLNRLFLRRPSERDRQRETERVIREILFPSL